tara:strand:- start:1211 stop:1732 length:522 start_codon:yes stop_codon:yes gene_type:complete
MNKILISACFLGQKVRYNGEIKSLIDMPVKTNEAQSVIEKQLFLWQKLFHWQQEGRLFSICPEVIGGLSVPRDPAEINQITGKVITINQVDVSEAFNIGAQHALDLCKRYNIKFALLKEFSPSCGSTSVYDGHFNGEKISGQGITSKLLIAHGIQVYSEQSFDLLVKAISVNQ